MKNYLLLLFVLIAFNACKKGSDVDPATAATKSPADGVSGLYKLSSFYYKAGTDEIDLPTMPYTKSGTTISGTANLTPLSATDKNHVALTLTLKVTGQQDGTIDFDMVEVKTVGQGYALYVDGSKIADANGNNIIFSLSETDAQTKQKVELRFVANK